MPDRPAGGEQGDAMSLTPDKRTRNQCPILIAAQIACEIEANLEETKRLDRSLRDIQEGRVRWDDDPDA